MKKLLLAAIFLIVPGLALADHHESSIVEMWKCSLKDGKNMEDLKANNTKWLAMTRKTTGNEEVNSYILTTIVGSQGSFHYADIYPDMATWSKAKSAEDTEEGKAIEAVFNELSDCTDNRLYKSEGS
jgi:hypothetical protein